MNDIRRVAVLGAGVMGAQIAAQIANAGTPVLLLDLPGETGARNAASSAAIARLAKMEPAPLMHDRAARLITAGNFIDDLPQLAECDWIIEAVVEKLEVKRDLYTKIESVRRDGCAVSSNTSTIPLHQLTDGLPARFARDFLITHFFNPPRYMRLLELVRGPATDAALAARIADYADRQLGKGIVPCRDTPGFIANRLGVFFLEAGVQAALREGLSVSAADALAGAPLGLPKTAIFGLLDLIGIDLMPLIATSMLRLLPAEDAYQALHRDLPLINQMIADGYTGRKGKGGFYRLERQADGSRAKQEIDLATGQYRPAMKIRLDSAMTRDLRALCGRNDPQGRFVWSLLRDTLSYAAAIAPSIADTIADIDAAMVLGYNWEQGPFGLLDRLGVGWFAEKLRAEGRPVPPLLEDNKPFYRIGPAGEEYRAGGSYVPRQRPAGVLLLRDLRLTQKPLRKNASASLWDIGDGIWCLEFHSKMNALDPDMLGLLGETIESLPRQGGRGLVIYNEGENFSAGANLGLALFALNVALYPAIADLVSKGQQVYRALRAAPFPSVVASHNLTLGGACELALHASAVQAHAETYLGLVETGVGIIPGWGGCARLLARAQQDKKLGLGPMPALGKVFETIATAKVARSAHEARALGYLRAEDGISMNRDRLLFDAKARALALATNYTPPPEEMVMLAGPGGKAGLMMAVETLRQSGLATAYDTVVAEALAEVLTGGAAADHTQPTPVGTLYAREAESFMRLVRNPETLARIEHMLETGKPLRN